MKKILFGTVALVASAAFGPLAIAADMPAPIYTKAPVAPEPTWTGWYVGVNGGADTSMSGQVNTRGTDTGAGGLGSALAAGAIPAPGAFFVDNNGYLIGGTLGYNWQINTFWVAGVEGDFDGGSRKSSNLLILVPGTFAPTTTFANREIESLGTVRGRLGFTIVGPMLFYGTGGLAVAQRSFGIGAIGPSYGPPLNAFSQTTNTATGWTVGAGVEFMWGPHWSFKGEWLYVDLGNISSSIAYAYPGNNSTLTATIQDHENIIRAGINYRF